MSDNDLVEQVAQAIFETHNRGAIFGDRDLVCWLNTKDWEREEYGELARAALTSIEAAGYVMVPRQPTEKMLIKGDGIFEDKNYDRRDGLREAYQAMIDAALEKDKVNAG